MIEYRANGAFQQAETVLKEATAKMTELQHSEPHAMREPSRVHPAMGDMKDRLRAKAS